MEKQERIDSALEEAKGALVKRLHERLGQQGCVLSLDDVRALFDRNFVCEIGSAAPVYIERDFLLKKIAELQRRFCADESERAEGFLDACVAISAFIKLMPECPPRVR